MERWLTAAVVGLNLCPFAKAPQAKGLVHYAVCEAPDWDGVLAALDAEAQALRALPPSVRETTLLVVPQALGDFVEFTGFLAQAELHLRRAGDAGVLQLASFHPDYAFAHAADDDVANCTNRAPYPTLHLLREASIDRAVAAFPQADAIYDANIGTLRELGWDGWRALARQWQ